MERGQPDFQWMSLAEQFPATLVTEIAPEKLKDGQTPDAYGMGLEKDGVLYKSAYTDTGSRYSTWTSESTPTNAPSGITVWKYQWDRMWGYVYADRTVYYGAYGNYDSYILQSFGKLIADNESSSLTGVHPFGKNLAIFKSNYFYHVPNADDTSANFRIYFAGDQGITGEDKCICLNDIIYFANTSGVWAFDGQRLIEITEPIRNSLGDVQGGAITNLNAEFDKARLVGHNSNTVKFVLVPRGQGGMGIYTYSGTDFRFTTRSLLSGEGNPLMVDKIALNYEYDSTSQIDVSYQVKINDTWKAEERMRTDSNIKHGRLELATANMLAARRWAFRLTDIPADFYIHSIEANVKTISSAGYSVKK
jgi:hypothetical protein